jgi:hypothetical protein
VTVTETVVVGICIDGRSVDVTICMSKLTLGNVIRLKILVLCAAPGPMSV